MIKMGNTTFFQNESLLHLSQVRFSCSLVRRSRARSFFAIRPKHNRHLYSARLRLGNRRAVSGLSGLMAADTDQEAPRKAFNSIRIALNYVIFGHFLHI